MAILKYLIGLVVLILACICLDRFYHLSFMYIAITNFSSFEADMGLIAPWNNYPGLVHTKESISTNHARSKDLIELNGKRVKVPVSVFRIGR